MDDNNLITFLNDMDKTVIEEKGESKKRLHEEEKEEEKSMKKAKRKKKVVLKPEAEEKDEEGNKKIATANDNEVWTNGIEATLNSWLQQIVYIESVFKTSKNAQLQIHDVLDKMRAEDLLSSNEFNELKEIGNLWHELVELIYCYYAGSVSNKKRIIELLLELYSLKQLTKEIFINTMEQL